MDKTTIFIMWLDGFLDSNDKDLNEEKTSKIRNKLNNVFKHDTDVIIDGKTSNDKKLKGEVTYRC